MKWTIISVKCNVIFHSNSSKEALDIAGLTHHAIFCPQFPTYVGARNQIGGRWLACFQKRSWAILFYMKSRHHVCYPSSFPSSVTLFSLTDIETQTE